MLESEYEDFSDDEEYEPIAEEIATAESDIWFFVTDVEELFI